jgi:hypothetical protein
MLLSIAKKKFDRLRLIPVRQVSLSKQWLLEFIWEINYYVRILQSRSPLFSLTLKSKFDEIRLHWRGLTHIKCHFNFALWKCNVSLQ